MADLLASDFTQEFFPASLPAPGGKSRRNKEELLEFFTAARGPEGIFESLLFAPPSDVVQGKDVVILHLKSEGTTKDGKKFNNEYMFTLRFSGEKIVYMGEFVDSKAVADFFPGGV
ncbi:hypothetical protein R3P38DRAFT_3532605 [Favolaschia claudopus]|uniref:SnoaL-like domain-containing protein n=1 Tax=Favolaschia claudopus TaxID=2862362 RepID=A0AAW0BG07_9AGAR